MRRRSRRRTRCGSPPAVPCRLRDDPLPLQPPEGPMGPLEPAPAGPRHAAAGPLADRGCRLRPLPSRTLKRTTRRQPAAPSASGTRKSVRSQPRACPHPAARAGAGHGPEHPAGSGSWFPTVLPPVLLQSSLRSLRTRMMRRRTMMMTTPARTEALAVLVGSAPHSMAGTFMPATTDGRLVCSGGLGLGRRLRAGASFSLDGCRVAPALLTLHCHHFWPTGCGVVVPPLPLPWLGGSASCFA